SLVFSAFRMYGRSPSNWTSTTAPRTCVTRPTILLAIGPIPRVSNGGFGAGDDLDQLFGDVGLARPIVVEREALNHVAGVARGAVHRGHLRAIEPRAALQQGAIDLDREILRQQPREDGLLVGLELVHRPRARLLRLIGR